MISNDDVIYCLLLPRLITEPNFNSILGMEIKSYGVAYPIPSSNHLCSTHSDLLMFCTIWIPRDFEILDWCPAGPVLPHGKNMSL